MTEPTEYFLNVASVLEITEHLVQCDSDFSPHLSSRVDIPEFVNKIVSNAIRFEAWSCGVLVGLVVAYYNDHKNLIAYVTNVSVLQEWTGKGIASCLMKKCIEHAKSSGMAKINLEVASDNIHAINLYKKFNFIVEKASEPYINMSLVFKNGNEHEA